MMLQLEQLAAALGAYPLMGGMIAALLLLLLLLLPEQRNLLLRLVPLLLTFSIISLWATVLLHSADNQADGYMLRDVAVLQSAQKVSLGHAMLMQNPGLAGSADQQHVQFERKRGEPGWQISNVSAQRRLRLEYVDDAGGTLRFDAARFRLETGDLLRLPSPDSVPAEIRFDAVTGNAITLHVPPRFSGARSRTYMLTYQRGAFSIADATGKSLPPCESSLRGGLAAFVLLRDLQRSLRTREALLLQFGGPLECVGDGGGALEFEGAPFGAATLLHVPGLGFALQPGRNGTAMVVRGSREYWLRNLPHDFVIRVGERRLTLRSFVAGYTRYEVVRPDPPDRLIAFRIVPLERSHRIMDGADTCNVLAAALNPGDVGMPVVAACRDAPNAGVEWRKPISTTASLMDGGWALAIWWVQQIGALPKAVPVQLLILAPVMLAGAILLWLYIRRRLRRDLGLATVVGLARAEIGIIRSAAFFFGLAILIGYVGWKFAPYAGPAPALPVIPWPALAAWAIAAVAVATARGAGLLDGLIMSAWTALLAVGHIAVLDLSFASGELRNLRFADDTTAAIAAMAAIVIMIAQFGPQSLASAIRSLVVPPAPKQHGKARLLPRGMIYCLGLIVFFLLLWMFFGTEAGITGVLQPSEVVKSLTVLVLAAAVTFALERDRDPSGPVMRLARWASFRPSIAALTWSVATLVRSRVGVFALAAAAVLFVRLVLIRRGIAAAACELVIAATALNAARLLLGRVSNYFWRAFLMILALLGFILFVPVLRNDLSPFIVLSVAAAVMLLFVVVIHWAAVASERLHLWRGRRQPPPDDGRTRVQKAPVLLRIRRFIAARIRIAMRRILGRPEPLMIGLAVAAAVTLAWVGSAALHDGPAARSWLTKHMGGGFDKPLERVISWIEFNGQGGERLLAVEFADVGLQVSRSRDVIAASACSQPEQGEQESGLEAPLLRLMRSSAQWLETAVVDPAYRLAATYLPADCTPVSRDHRTASFTAVRMPAIQNDFISTWLIARYGRDGALGVLILQCGMFVLMLFAGFFAIKWSPGHLNDRPAAAVAGYATIGFAVMVAVQWAISWLNALGLLPVMGQPSTFFSHGPSHALLFGLPAALVALTSLRVRSAFQITDPPGVIDPVPWRFIRPWRR
jgi:hypothetical protein